MVEKPGFGTNKMPGILQLWEPGTKQKHNEPDLIQRITQPLDSMESNKYTGMSYFNLLKFPNPTSFPAHMGYIVFQGLGCCFKTDIFRLVDNRREGACSIPHAWINCSHWDRTKATQLTPFILPMVTPSSSMSRKALEA